MWNPDEANDSVWGRLRQHFDDMQIVELGAYIALTFGQQRVIKTWNIGSEEYADSASSHHLPKEVRK